MLPPRLDDALAQQVASSLGVALGETLTAEQRRDVVAEVKARQRKIAEAQTRAARPSLEEGSPAFEAVCRHVEDQLWRLRGLPPVQRMMVPARSVTRVRQAAIESDEEAQEAAADAGGPSEPRQDVIEWGTPLPKLHQWAPIAFALAREYRLGEGEGDDDDGDAGGGVMALQQGYGKT